MPGDQAGKIKLALSVDASFADNIDDNKSTGGAYVYLIGKTRSCLFRGSAKSRGKYHTRQQKQR